MSACVAVREEGLDVCLAIASSFLEPVRCADQRQRARYFAPIRCNLLPRIAGSCMPARVWHDAIVHPAEEPCAWAAAVATPFEVVLDVAVTECAFSWHLFASLRHQPLRAIQPDVRAVLFASVVSSVTTRADLAAFTQMWERLVRYVVNLLLQLIQPNQALFLHASQQRLTFPLQPVINGRRESKLESAVECTLERRSRLQRTRGIV